MTILSGRSLPLLETVDDGIMEDDDGFGMSGVVCCAASLASDNGVRCGCLKLELANLASVFGLYFSGRHKLNEFDRKYL